MDAQSESLEQFIDQVIDEKGFLDLTPEVREEIKNDLRVRIDDFITAKVIAALSDDDVVLFEGLLNKKASNEELQQFVVERIPDFTNFISNTLLEFRDVYLGLVAAPQDASYSSSSSLGSEDDL